ncbi:uncharacterized protein LOC136030806 [Artemia franciscana]|uniref:uncharacterized protein LOC136030806 n=1 Tax=Artemia franciscana TaxID=6661 RepID=UPI0032DBB8D2
MEVLLEIYASNKWRGKMLLDLDYVDDLSILDESVSKKNEFLNVLRLQGVKIGLKINVKKTKSLRLGLSEDEQVTLGNETLDHFGSFSYLGSINSKDGGSSEDVKSTLATQPFRMLNQESEMQEKESSESITTNISHHSYDAPAPIFLRHIHKSYNS